MNRALLKQDAKDAMRMANPHPALTTLALLAISLAVGKLIQAVTMIFSFAGGLTESGAIIFVGAVVGFVLSIASILIVGVLQYAYYVYSLKVFRKEETGIGELFAHFPMMLKVFGLFLWMALFAFLWSMLCYIPGIIALLRYSQAFYILAENPDKSIRECVNESKVLMSGRLWEYFVLQLSFILWLLLTAVTYGIASLYVTPYMSITNAGYYLSLKPVEPSYSSSCTYTSAAYTDSTTSSTTSSTIF